jgi:chromosome partitioning protein
VLARYDIVLADCPPSLGRILIAGLVSATDLLVVTEPGTHAARGVSRIEESAGEIREGFDQETPRLVGVVINRVKRTGEHV